MTEADIIKEKKRNIYSSYFQKIILTSFYLNLSLHHVVSLEVYENNNLMDFI